MLNAENVFAYNVVFNFSCVIIGIL